MNTLTLDTRRSATGRSRFSGARSAALVLLGLLGMAQTAFAEDRTGQVREVRVHQDNYMGLRVKLHGVSSFCSGGARDEHIAHLSRDSPMYDDVLTALTAALFTDQTVMIRSARDGAFCRITQVEVRP